MVHQLHDSQVAFGPHQQEGAQVLAFHCCQVQEQSREMVLEGFGDLEINTAP